MRLALFVAVAALAACSPSRPPEKAAPAPAATGEAVVTPVVGDDAPVYAARPLPPLATQAVSEAHRAAVLRMLQPALEADIGKPLRLDVLSVAFDGDWGWAVVQPRAPDGGRVDFAGTHYAELDAQGLLANDGRTYVLLRQDGPHGWLVADFMVGPAETAWTDWPRRHGAPPDIMDLE